MQFVLSSRNAHKAREFREILETYLPDAEILTLDDVKITGEAVEDGRTFAENAMKKAAFAATSGYISIADDSGLCVESLGGAPGIYSARYAGAHGNDAANLDKLLSDMKDKKDRRAYFACAIACVFPDGRSFTVEGRCEGILTEERHGNGGFGYDPILFYPAAQKTLGEMSAEEKNSISHRAKAIALFAEKIKEYL